jgi:hypothetical protein
MKLFKFFLGLMTSVVMALFVGVAVSSATQLPVLPTSGAIFVAGMFVPQMQGVLPFAVQVELWVDYIIGNLFKDNPFIKNCFDESEHVLGGSVVHVPQAGAKPTIVKNRSSLPATAVQRTDTDITYPLDVYTSDPTLITNAEQMEISYDKMSSVLGEHLESMSETIGDQILFKWAPTASAQIIRTTGTATPAHLSSATGNRKKLVKEDLKKARKIMDKQNIPKTDRYALIDADMYDQLCEDADLLKRDGVNGGELDLKEGIVMRLYGFSILTRSNTVRYDNAGTPAPKAPDAAGAADDNSAVICWQKNAVAKALGTTDFFEDTKNPLYYGDIYSILQKMGARKRRTNGEGVVAIVQDASA